MATGSGGKAKKVIKKVVATASLAMLPVLGACGGDDAFDEFDVDNNVAAIEKEGDVDVKKPLTKDDSATADDSDTLYDGAPMRWK